MGDTLKYDIENPKLLRIAEDLMGMGLNIVGTMDDFHNYYPSENPGLWVCAECTPELFDYWGSRPDIVHDERIQAYIDRIGYWEWRDPGTVTIYLD